MASSRFRWSIAAWRRRGCLTESQRRMERGLLGDAHNRRKALRQSCGQTRRARPQDRLRLRQSGNLCVEIILCSGVKDDEAAN
jgi:hypothetical protein